MTKCNTHHPQQKQAENWIKRKADVMVCILERKSFSEAVKMLDNLMEDYAKETKSQLIKEIEEMRLTIKAKDKIIQSLWDKKEVGL